MKAAEAKQLTSDVLELKLGSDQMQSIYKDIRAAANNGKYSLEVGDIALHDKQWLRALGYKVTDVHYRFDGLSYNKVRVNWD